MNSKGKTRKGTKVYGRFDHRLAARQKPARIARRRALTLSERRVS